MAAARCYSVRADAILAGAGTHDMIEENFVRLYAHDFVRLAIRSEMGSPDPDALQRRIREARAHAAIMDARKGGGHLAALASRVRDEAKSFNDRAVQKGADLEAARLRHRVFLTDIAKVLQAQTVDA